MKMVWLQADGDPGDEFWRRVRRDAKKGTREALTLAGNPYLWSTGDDVGLPQLWASADEWGLPDDVARDVLTYARAVPGWIDDGGGKKALRVVGRPKRRKWHEVYEDSAGAACVFWGAIRGVPMWGDHPRVVWWREGRPRQMHLDALGERLRGYLPPATEGPTGDDEAAPDA